MTTSRPVVRTLLTFSAASVLAFNVAAQSQAPSTAAAAKEVAALLVEKKLEAFAARVPGETGRYVGVMLVPGVQLIVASGLHGRSTDAEYYLYNKDYRSAYMDINSSMLVTERVVVSDALADGLVGLPGKNLAHDSFRKGTTTQTFDGDFADPRRKNQKKIPQDEYMKLFSEAEQIYAKFLGILAAELKKTAADR